MGFNMAGKISTFDTRLKRMGTVQKADIFSAKRRRIRMYKLMRLLAFQLVIYVGLVYAGLTGTKIYQFQKMGAQAYSAHLLLLDQGEQPARIAAKLMQPDWFMRFVLDKIQVPQNVL
jgi:hypothetical protein